MVEVEVKKIYTYKQNELIYVCFLESGRELDPCCRRGFHGSIARLTCLLPTLALTVTERCRQLQTICTATIPFPVPNLAPVQFHVGA